jgi:hypothetical protein
MMEENMFVGGYSLDRPTKPEIRGYRGFRKLEALGGMLASWTADDECVVRP